MTQKKCFLIVPFSFLIGSGLTEENDDKMLIQMKGSDYMDDFVSLLLYVPSQQLWSLRDGQFTQPYFFLGRLEQVVNQ